jgi:small subunit ribosomal protein S6
MNIECDGKVLAELEGSFRFSDAVIRHLTTRLAAAVTEPSPMAKAGDEKGEDNRGDRGDRDDRDDRPSRRDDRDDRDDRPSRD